MTSAEVMPKPSCKLGYTQQEVEQILATAFYKWMTGQTMAICEGQTYNHEAGEYEPACGGAKHGVIVYPHDLYRYLAGLPVVD